ncbi:hypothetical protein [Ancylothrix sp. D3o]|uniref:hypothetical protein n=1 Tax=Ancylothrix sp. D3o TaxID=2953691 RepID=UPI00294FF8F9|nr:hypothetical protein [Ancylothrix sp. D3o]
MIAGIILSLGLSALPVQAQITDAKVGALVEALRQAAPKTGTENDGLYSEWQIKPDNIKRWSRLCTGKELTPVQFERSPQTARGILVCVMRDILKDEYKAGGNNEDMAVRRAAAWWMTGDPTQYGRENIAGYTQQVLKIYQQQRSTGSGSSK